MAEIDELHERFGRADTLAEYLEGLAAIGVASYESFVSDGHTEYVDAEGHRQASPPQHEVLTIADIADAEVMREHLARHGDGETSYVEMSRGLAASGVERWVADTAALTLTYCDRSGAALLVEQV